MYSSLWPWVVVTIIVSLLALRLFRLRHKSAIGMACAFATIAMYYMQGPNDIDFIQTWGRPLTFIVYVSVLVFLVSLLRERNE